MLTKYSQNYQDIATVPEIPVEEPQIQPVPDVQPTVETPKEPVKTQVQSKLVHWKAKRGNRTDEYLNLDGVEPDSPLAAYLQEVLGYKYNPRRKQFSKVITPEISLNIEAEFNDMEAKFPVSVDRTAIAQIQQTFGTESMDGRVGEPGEIDDIKKIKFLNVDDKEKWKIAKEFVQKELANLATMVDEAGKEDFIQKFLALNSKFYNYSFYNRFMIILQQMGRKDMSGQVARLDKWSKDFGREVKPEEIGKGFDIFVPMGGKPSKVRPWTFDAIIKAIYRWMAMNKTQPEKMDLTNRDNMLMLRGFIKKEVNAQSKYPTNLFYLDKILKQEFTHPNEMIAYLQNKKVEGDYSDPPLRFTMKPVYDMNQTEIIPGQEGKDPAKIQAAVEGKWQSKNNTPTERTNSLIDLSVRAAQNGSMQKGKDVTEGTNVINIKRNIDTGEAGGWSRGTEIGVSRGSAGERELSTIIHELAHSILHWGKDRGMLGGNKIAKEAEAEATAYIVLKHYGFTEPSFAANYIALNKGNKDLVISRFESVLTAANKIVAGIEQQKMEDFKAADKQASGNWYKKVAHSDIYGKDVDKLLKIIKGFTDRMSNM